MFSIQEAGNIRKMLKLAENTRFLLISLCYNLVMFRRLALLALLVLGIAVFGFSPEKVQAAPDAYWFTTGSGSNAEVKIFYDGDIWADIPKGDGENTFYRNEVRAECEDSIYLSGPEGRTTTTTQFQRRSKFVGFCQGDGNTNLEMGNVDLSDPNIASTIGAALTGGYSARWLGENIIEVTGGPAGEGAGAGYYLSRANNSSIADRFFIHAGEFTGDVGDSSCRNLTLESANQATLNINGGSGCSGDRPKYIISVDGTRGADGGLETGEWYTRNYIEYGGDLYYDRNFDDDLRNFVNIGSGACEFIRVSSDKQNAAVVGSGGGCNLGISLTNPERTSASFAWLDRSTILGPGGSTGKLFTNTNGGTDYANSDSCGDRLGVVAEIGESQGTLHEFSGSNDVCEANLGNNTSTVEITRVEASNQDSNDLVSGSAGTPDPSCESNISDLGWILCPVAQTLLNIMDDIVGGTLVEGILTFDLVNTQYDALQSIWVGFRTIANLGFVIAFFVVIYAAATGNALSAYDVKKILPRLVVGAIAVQLSFFICVELANLFNAFGKGIEEVMLSPLPEGGGVASLYNDSGIEGGVINNLSAFAEGAATAITLVLLIIGFIMSLLGVLMMIVVFLLRNMALLILTVLSPLAFVAWILPNTESYFKKWFNFYIQLLALFPIAVMFLASGRLVGSIWSAGNGFAAQWIGMIAMFAPYIIAPKLLTFAGAAIQGIVRGAQGARKGLSENFAKASTSRIGQKAKGGALIKERGTKSRKFNTAVRGLTNPRSTRANFLPGGDRARSLARARSGYEKLLNEDTLAAEVNQRTERAQVRADAATDTEGKHYKEAYAAALKDSPKAAPADLAARASRAAADNAEIALLADKLTSDGATNEEKRAAVKTLVNVHSNSGKAITSVREALGQMKDTGGTEGARLADQIIQDNISAAGSVPQVIKPNSSGTIEAMDPSQFHSLKSGSLQDFLANPEARGAIVSRMKTDYANPQTKSLVRKGTVKALIREDSGLSEAQRTDLKDIFKDMLSS